VRDFQRIEFHPRRIRSGAISQYLLDGPAYHLFFINTEDSSRGFARQAKESPSCFSDFSIQSVSIKIFDESPARQENFTLERQVPRQWYAFPDQNGGCSTSVQHLSFPELRDP
jgi:hypothetical protein